MLSASFNRAFSSAFSPRICCAELGRVGTEHYCTVPTAHFNTHSTHVRERHRFMWSRPHIVTVHQPAQLLTGHLDHFLLEQTRPVEPLPALNHLVIKTIPIDVPCQKLDRVKSLVGEDKERRLKGVL